MDAIRDIFGGRRQTTAGGDRQKQAEIRQMLEQDRTREQGEASKILGGSGRELPKHEGPPQDANEIRSSVAADNARAKSESRDLQQGIDRQIGEQLFGSQGHADSTHLSDEVHEPEPTQAAPQIDTGASREESAL